MCSKRELVIVALIAVILQSRIADADVAPTSDLSGRHQHGVRGQFPYLAVIATSYNYYGCGGALLSDRWVISTATCTQYSPVEQTLIIVGAESTMDGDIYLCEAIKTHENFNLTTGENNIAIFRSNRPILLTQYVQPTAYFRGQSEPCKTTHVTCMEAHNGMISSGNYQILYMNVSKISNKECQSIWSNIGRPEVYSAATSISVLPTYDYAEDYPQYQICGRNGSPLVATDSGVLLGLQHVVYDCNLWSPLIFVEVSQFGDWIEETTNVRGVDVL